jgi:hypothetical protein
MTTMSWSALSHGLELLFRPLFWFQARDALVCFWQSDEVSIALVRRGSFTSDEKNFLRPAPL